MRSAIVSVLHKIRGLGMTRRIKGKTYIQYEEYLSELDHLRKLLRMRGESIGHLEQSMKMLELEVYRKEQIINLLARHLELHEIDLPIAIVTMSETRH